MSEKQNGVTTDNITIQVDSGNGGKSDIEVGEIETKISNEKPQNGDFNKFLQISNGKDLLGVPRQGHRMSFMEEENIKDKIRLSLLKQCSAILKQGDQRYNKESLHRAFQDEDLLERIFRLFDVERKDHLVQEDWFEFLKERLREEKELDFVEQVEIVAYVLCGDAVITLDTFQLILKNKIVTNKLLKLVDTDGDGYVTADEVMEFITAVSSCRPHVGFDKCSIDRLEQLFRQTAGDQKEITREQFQKIVVSKNPFFTERVFQIFDGDNSGTISHQEFIEAVHKFGSQSPEDKIRFLFKVYDLDGDGLIQPRELQHVLRACMVENGMQFSSQQLLELSAAMFEDAGAGASAAITYEALRDQLAKHGGLLENLSISIDRWLVPPNPKPQPKSLYQRLAKLKPYQLSLPYFRNNYVYVTYLFIYFAINLGLFAARIVEYWHYNVFVIFARACGQCLNFNCTWILVLMLRRTLTQLRALRLGAALPLDHHVYLHKLTGVVVVVLSAAHTAMHLCNFTLIVVNDPIQNPNNLTSLEWLCTTRPAVLGLCAGCANPTGLVLCVVLLGLAASSRPAIRKGGCFEVFYFAHLLYIPFWILLIFHAPNFWKWFLVPGVIYLIERIMRLAWTRSEVGKTYILSGALLPSRVTHVVARRPPHFDFHAGDYVYVNVPAVAAHEWHPFTVSSAPELQDYLWLHIRGVGEWTNRLYSYFEEEQRKSQANEKSHDPARRASARSARSRRRSSANKRSVEFSPFAFSNDAFTIEEETHGPSVPLSVPASVSPVVTRPSFLTPLKLLEKSRSMPDVRNANKQNANNPHTYHRSESTYTLPEGNNRSGFRCSKEDDVTTPGAGGAALSLAHSFRYMRTKPPIIACRPPSEERRRSNESILSIARRRLSKSISPDKDIEVNEKPDTSIETASHIAPDEDDDNYHITKPLEIYLDGPYGAPSSHIFRASHAALIAAGIGVTPFASILQAIMYRHRAARATCPRCRHAFATQQLQPNMNLKKVDFFWINREQRSFEWFVSLLSQLEMEQAEAEALAEEREKERLANGGEQREKKEKCRFLEMHMYITSALQRSDMKAVGLQLALDLLHEKGKRDLITGLKTRTNAGRPNWDKVFQRLQQQRRGHVTVFYCGPPALARALRVKCDQFGFTFKKEVF